VKLAFAAAAVLALSSTAALAEPVRTPVLRSTTTVAGQPIVFPQGPLEITVYTLVIPVGERLPTHKHPYPHDAYVLSGTAKITNLDSNRVDHFKAGDYIVEALNQRHYGEAVGSEPVKLLVIDHTPPGQAATVPTP
jgi:quercetin dioxygenase-like cupin family protein